PALGPVFLTAGLFGVSVLGAQAPLSTFARTDPDVYGYGLGTTGFATSLIIGIYLIGMIAGALLFPVIARLTTPRITLI
ncbi:MAG: MFS transporter, partial [Microbacterium sp.]